MCAPTSMMNGYDTSSLALSPTNNTDKFIGIGGMTAQAGGGVFAAGSSILAGQSKAGYYDFLAQQDKNNAKLAIQSGDIGSAAVQQEAGYQTQMLQKKNAQFNASQQARMAGNGVDLSSVSAQDVTHDSLHEESLDEQAIRFSADQKSAAIRNDAIMKHINSNASASMNTAAAGSSMAEGVMGGVSSLLSTAGQFADNYAKGKKAGMFDIQVDHPSGEMAGSNRMSKEFLGNKNSGSLTVPFAQGTANDTGVNVPWKYNGAQEPGPMLDLLKKMNPVNRNIKAVTGAWGI